MDPAREGGGVTETDAGIAAQLDGDAGVTAGEIEAMLDRVPADVRPLLRELLAQQTEVFSPRRIASALVAMHGRIVALAGGCGVATDNIYYYVPEGGRSFGLIAMAYREVTGAPVDHFIEGITALTERQLGADTMVVVLDDVAGSGQVCLGAWHDTRSAKYPGQVVIAPILSTTIAADRFQGAQGVMRNDPRLSYLPGVTMDALQASSWYRSLDARQRAALYRAVGNRGHDNNGLSVAMPYMAPDNNNRMFGTQLAADFVVNRNRSAVKTSGQWPPSEANQPP